MPEEIENRASDQQFISPKQLGARFGKSAEWARILVRNNRIEAIRELGSIMIPISQVGRIINSAERRKV
tara:strand:+ start:659 stop:865 length:207 start_codon:yes stop_codon:yes gene_type:complete